MNAGSNVVIFLAPRPILEQLKTITRFQELLTEKNLFAYYTDLPTHLDMYPEATIVMYIHEYYSPETWHYLMKNHEEQRICLFGENLDDIYEFMTGKTNQRFERMDKRFSVFYYFFEAIRNLKTPEQNSAKENVVILSSYPVIGDVIRLIVAGIRKNACIEPFYMNDPTDFHPDSHTKIIISFATDEVFLDLSAFTILLNYASENLASKMMHVFHHSPNVAEICDALRKMPKKNYTIKSGIGPSALSTDGQRVPDLIEIEPIGASEIFNN